MMQDTSQQRTRAPLALINITPLLDVLLILVAVLLVLAPHLVKPLPVDLPRTALNGTPVVRTSIQVVLQNDGTLWMSGRSASLKEVKLAVTPGVTTVEVAADRHSTYEAVVALVEKLRDSEPKDIVLLTQ